VLEEHERNRMHSYAAPGSAAAGARRRGWEVRHPVQHSIVVLREERRHRGEVLINPLTRNLLLRRHRTRFMRGHGQSRRPHHFATVSWPLIASIDQTQKQRASLHAVSTFPGGAKGDRTPDL
jgi:hypothetical protein